MNPDSANNHVTIIIKCKADPHVLKTIRSIDHDAEIIVSLVPDETDLKTQIELTGARVLDAPDNNAAASANIGLAEASYECCIFTDSDTIFGPGYIKACLDSLRHNDFSRGRIKFLKDRSIPGSSITAAVRDFFYNNLQAPYMPGMAVRRSFVRSVGGFDGDIRWSVDRDFSLRAIDAGGRFAFLDTVWITHLPISPLHDYRAALRTGSAWRIRDTKRNRRTKGILNGWLKSTMTSPLYEPYAALFRHKGMAAALHHFMWVSAYHWGYWRKGGKALRGLKSSRA